jgi:hypothetical protein
MLARIAAVIVPLVAGAAASQPAITIVRTYEIWLREGPRVPVETFDSQCGPATGPFELLRPDTPRQVAAGIARTIDATVPPMIREAYGRASALLPGPGITACVYAAELSRGLPLLGGVGGISVGGGRIELFLHPTTENFAKVPYTVAHEYHHEVLRTVSWGFGAREIMVQEGKADHFAYRLYPQLRPPHTNPLSDDELAIVWRAFLRYQQDRGPDFAGEFMIARQGGLPRWAGYRLAFEMVGYYLASAGLDSPREWLRADVHVIVDRFARSPRVERAIASRSRPVR